MTIQDSYDFAMENVSIEFPCKPEDEKRVIQELRVKSEANLREGNLYYVISNRWFTAWQRYTRQVDDSYPFYAHSILSQSSTPLTTKDRPGPIDNTDIIVDGKNSKDIDPQIPRTSEEGKDYVLVPQEVWEKLFKWYKGGPPLPRSMISVGDQQKQFVVEVFPLCLKLIDSRDQSEVDIRISKKASLRELYRKVSELKDLESEKPHIWDYFNKEKHMMLFPSDQTLEESNLLMDQCILLEIPSDGFGRDSTGNSLALVPVEPARSNFSVAGGPTMSNGYISINPYFLRSSLASANGDVDDENESSTKSDGCGLAGLQNLGNTCFMNSALQCLVHTPQIVDYFRKDYTDEINAENPLGMRGELAIAFGGLLRKLWSSGRNPVAPRVFKGKLAHFAPQFSGFNQHDSQELLAFLLDGLHEDLNRVKQKPYFETKDYDGRPDSEVAEELWRNHKARNDSIMVDICQGQYKSTLVCPNCEKVSITFDPFMYLSVPLPSTATRKMTVTVIYGDGSGLPTPFTVTVLKQGCCGDLSKALAAACRLRADEYLLFAEVYNHSIRRYLENPSEPLTEIRDDEHVVAYRLPKTEGESTRLEISHRYMGIERKLFLAPLVTLLEDPLPQCAADVDRAVGRVLSPFKKKSIHNSNATTHDSACNGSISNSRKDDSGPEETKEITSKKLSFHLCLTDDKGFACRPIAKDTPLKPGHAIKVILDWTRREYDLYDYNSLKDLPEVQKPGVAAKKTKQEAVSIFSCLEAFLKEEPLGPDDMWYCPNCKEHRQASKKLDLWRLPEVLVFHLKRFSYSRWLKSKIDAFVDFPIHGLDLSRYVKSKDVSEGSNLYELYAVSNHYGGLGGGHYSAYCKLIKENRWYHFDDSYVSPVGESDIRTSAAYVLFYRRVKPATATASSDVTMSEALGISTAS